MPGVVKSISCEVGDSVEEGTTIVVLEAMKMQNPLFAPMTGRMCIQHVKTCVYTNLVDLCSVPYESFHLTNYK